MLLEQMPWVWRLQRWCFLLGVVLLGSPVGWRPGRVVQTWHSVVEGVRGGCGKGMVVVQDGVSRNKYCAVCHEGTCCIPGWVQTSVPLAAAAGVVVVHQAPHPSPVHQPHCPCAPPPVGVLPRWACWAGVQRQAQTPWVARGQLLV